MQVILFGIAHGTAYRYAVLRTACKYIFVLRTCVCRAPTLSSVAAAAEMAVEAVVLDTLETTETGFLCLHKVRQMKKANTKKVRLRTGIKT